MKLFPGSFPLSSHPWFLLPNVLCLSASGRRSWQGQRWLCCCGVRGIWWCRWLLRRLEAEVWEFSSGELCERNTLWCKERWRAAIGCPQQRMPSPVPLGRLCSDLAGLWETHGQHWYPWAVPQTALKQSCLQLRPVTVPRASSLWRCSP